MITACIPIYRRLVASRGIFLLLVWTLFSYEIRAQVSGYAYRLHLETDSMRVSGPGDLTNFPVLVDLTDNDLRTIANGGKVESSNGFDIVFTGSDGSTVLNHQQESFNPSTGRLVAWVQIPTLSSSANTPFYIYFGNSSITVDPSTTATWDTNYQLVHHYQNGTDDATSAGNNGTDNGTVQTTGKIGNARLFDGNDFISVPDNATLDITGQITLSGWINPSNAGSGPDLITKGNWNESYTAYLQNNRRLRFLANGNNPISGLTSLNNGAWYHLVLTKSAAGRTIYLNGVQDANDANTTAYQNSNNPLNISSSSNPFNGTMDEIRISNVARSAGWIATEYTNQNEPTTFISVISDSPVLVNMESTPQSFVVGGDPVNITSNLTVSDPFYTRLQSATVQITGNYVSSEDLLAFSNTANISGSWDSVTGTLTLSGSAPLSEYQTALRNVTYENTNTIIPDPVTRSIAVTVDNGTDTSNTVTRQLDVVTYEGQFTTFKVEQAPSGDITSKTAGQEFDIRISAIDGSGNVDTTFSGTVVITSTGTLGIGVGTTASFTNGVLSTHTVSITGTGSITITATNSLGPEAGTSNLFTVLPGLASEVTSTISASPQVILNDGSSTSTITVQLKDLFGNKLITGGDNVILTTGNGSLSSITDNGDGTYSATLTSSTSQVTATITGTVNSSLISDNAQVKFAVFNAIWESQPATTAIASDWNRGANWSSGTVPGPGDVVLIPVDPASGSEHPVVDATGQTVGEIVIETGADITVSGGINFIIEGNLSGGGEVNGSGNDTLTAGGDISVSSLPVGTINLNGTSKQTVSRPHTYTNLVIDNAAGVEVSDNLFVNGTLTLSAGTLTIPSSKNMIANTKNIGSGQLAFERIISGDKGWRMLSSPVASTYADLLDSTVTQGYPGAYYDSGASPYDTLQPTVLWYDETYPGTDNQRWRAPASAADALTAGRGLFVYFFGDIAADDRYNNPLPDTLRVTGQEFEGDGTEFDFNVTYTTSADSGWNFVSNPFGATLDWDASGWTKTNIDNTIYVWDPEANGGNGEYLTWNGSTGTLGSGRISPFQGFWIKANSPAPVLKINKSNKTTGGVFKRKAPMRRQWEQEEVFPVAELSVHYDDLSARTSIVFQNTAKAGKDINDGYRLLPFTNTFLELFTLLPDGSQLSVNNLPREFDNRVLIPLETGGYMKQDPIEGVMHLTWSDFRNLPNDWIVTLVDNKTGDEINMLQQQHYPFEVSAINKGRYKSNNSGGEFRLKEKSAGNSRFTVRISTEEIESRIPNQSYLSQNYPNPFNLSTTIRFGLSEDTDVELEIYDILGRKVRSLISERLGAGVYTPAFDARGLASGVYLYRLVAGDRMYVKKFTFIK